MADTFTFDVGAPVQGAVSEGGGYRPTQVIGGNVTGGAVNQPAPVGIASGLGDYFDKLTAPAMERARRKKFVQGMTDQMYAEAGHEIRAGNGLLTQIFGPTDYEQGAMYYESQNRVQQAMQEWAGREDELKKLPREQVAQEWAKLMEATTTGDQFLDDLVGQDMLKQAAPALQAVAKANYKYGQETVVKAQQTAWSNASAAYQAQMQQFFETQDPNAPLSQGAEVATQNFLQSFLPPKGQDEDSYRKSLSAAFRTMIRDGSGHAATALMRAGILDELPEDERIRAEDQYHRFGQRAIGDAAAKFMGDIDVLQGKLEFGQLTGQEAVGQMSKINDKLKRYAGFDDDYFDTTDQEAAVKGVWSARRRALEKQEERAFQLQRDQANNEAAAERDRMRAEIDATNGIAAYNSANPAAAVAAGAAKADALQGAVYKGYLENDFAGMQRAWKSGASGVSADVKSLIQNTISANINTGYSREFEGLHQKFNGMVQVNAALAKEYFGPQFPAMVNYNRLLGSQTPEVAFAMAFGDDIQYAPDTPQIASAKKAVVKWINSEVQPSAIGGFLTGNKALNDSAVSELANLLGREVAQDAKFAGGNLSNTTLLKGAYDRAINNGTFEKYGNLGWSNRPGTTPLWRTMGMQPQEAEIVVQNLIDKKLKAVGFPDGASGDEYTIVRGRKDGKDTVIVVPVLNGALDSSKTVVIRGDEFRNAGIEYRRSQTAAGAKRPSTRNGLLGYGGPGGDFITGN